jgi:dienelactone hydrolase
MLVKNTIEYHDKDCVLEGYYVYDDAIKGKRPLVLVAHDWTGRNELSQGKAEQLAELGYIGFALDMYGKGKRGHSTEEKVALMQPLMENRELLQRRITAGLDCAKKIEFVDTHKIAAMGYCFGGLCVLDLARSGADIQGVVSFHGLLNPPPHKNQLIKAKLLVLHGHDDPMVTPDNVLAFENEMTKDKVDWQINVYSNTKHAFANPMANDPVLGTIYNPVADKRSWIAAKNFFEEVFKNECM